MKRYQLINSLIKTYNYKTYLEIGLNNPSENYLKVNCESKESVDPYIDNNELYLSDIRNSYIDEEIEKNLTYRMTSDEFFEQNTKTYDIIFIDGLHTKEQVSKDIFNSLKTLNKGGRIVVHDCLPTTELTQRVPRESNEWYGDVWKSIYEFLIQGVTVYTVNTDCGCAIFEYYDKIEEITLPTVFRHEWEHYVKFKECLLNIMSVETFVGLLTIDMLDEIRRKGCSII